jgi:beta-mannosidase
MTQSLELPQAAPPRTRVRVQGHEVRQLSDGWRAACTPPGLSSDPATLDAQSWFPARVPGTAAAALRDAGVWHHGSERDFDAEDWWFRTRFDAPAAGEGEEVVLRLDGIATVAEVFLNGELVLESDSMFQAHVLDVGTLLRGENELTIRCRALAPLLGERRRPRARWRSRLIANGNIRFFRTMILGRAPGFAPGPAAVGPWRAVRLERRKHVAVEELTLRTAVSGEQGRLTVRACLRGLDGAQPLEAEIELTSPSGSWRAPLALTGAGAGGADAVALQGDLVVPEVSLWWPHTHGEPALYDAHLIVTGRDGEVIVDAGRVGFRALSFGRSAGHDVEVDGVQLHVNGVAVFARGCVWTPVDAVGMAPSQASLRAALEQVRDAGMNLVRVPGTSAYEEEAFHDLCDELGVLVWQDFMFANLDYPISDDAFRAAVTREAEQVLKRLAGRPSLAVVCGNSEVEQQVAMLGLDPSLGRGELFGELLPALVRESGAEALYVPSAPCGGDLPFRPERGVSNYYGVGGYRRPLEDARRAEVRFAAECLAFSNVPDEAAIEAMLPDEPGGIVVHDPRWKAGVPRDSGSGWDFEDVRDHYLELLFGVQPAELRRVDHPRYLELSRALTGEIMGEVFGEWRRSGSPCSGGLVLWLRDIVPGAGWGVIDERGEPKAAYHHLRRALAPVAVWMTDEGLAGVHAHVANDAPAPLHARLRLALYRDFEHRVDQAEETIEVAPHSVRQWDIEALLGRFVDASWAYRFGPPAQDLIVASLHTPAEGGELLSQSVRFPAGRPLVTEPAGDLGLIASAHVLDGGAAQVSVRSARFAYGVRVCVPGFRASDDAFSVEPAGERSVLLSPSQDGAVFAGGWLTALNLRGRVKISPAEQADRSPVAGARSDPVPATLEGGSS